MVRAFVCFFKVSTPAAAASANDIDADELLTPR